MIIPVFKFYGKYKKINDRESKKKKTRNLRNMPICQERISLELFQKFYIKRQLFSGKNQIKKFIKK